MTNVKVHVSRFGKTAVFDHTLVDTSAAKLEAVKDLFEGQVGAILAIYDANGPLFQATNAAIVAANSPSCRKQEQAL